MSGRFLGLSVVSHLALSGTALAGDPTLSELDRVSNDAILEFRGVEPVLDATNGVEFELGIPDLNITIGAAPAGNLAILVEGVSSLDWDADTEDVLAHRIQPLPNGGSVAFDGNVELFVDLDILGLQFDLFSLDLPFQSATDGFGSFVLADDGDAPLQLGLASNQLAFDENFGVAFIADLISPGLGVAIAAVADAGIRVYGNPTSNVVASGRFIDSQINGDLYRLENTQSFVPVFLDDPMAGIDGQSNYEMQTVADVGYVVGLEAYLDVLGIIDLDFSIWTLELPLFADTRNVNYLSEAYRHALPWAELAADMVDFGELAEGSSDVMEIVLDNLGELELQALTVFEGSEAFSVSPTEIFIDGLDDEGNSESTTLLVTFSPTTPGQHVGTIFLETNDPTLPYVEIPVSGSAAAPVEDGPDGSGSPDDGLYTPPGRSTLYQACGCSSATSPTGAMAWVGLLGGMMLVRRRRD